MSPAHTNPRMNTPQTDAPASWSSPPPRLSVVIPAYHEAHRLPANLVKVAEYLEGRFPGAADRAVPADYEVLVMVERSADDTLARCRAAVAGLGKGFEVVDNQVHRGKGYAVRLGMRRARGEVRLFLDADLSTPLEEIGRFLDHLAAHPTTDVLVGDRRRAESRIGRPQGALRRGLGRVFSALARWTAGGSVGLPADLVDTQCGFKAFRATAAEAIFCRQRLDGFAFDVEVLCLAARLGLRVESLPVRGWTNSPATTLRVVRDGWAMLRDLARVRVLVERTMHEQPATRPMRTAANLW